MTETTPERQRFPIWTSNTTYQVRVRGKNDEGEGPWAEGIGSTERAELNVAFNSEIYSVDEGEEATIAVTVTPSADRDVTLTVTMTGTGTTLSGLTDGMLTIARESELRQLHHIGRSG